MSILKLVEGTYPGATFDDLVISVAEHNQMLMKSHKVHRRAKNRISLVCSAGPAACDFQASATPLKKGKRNLGGVEGIRITKFTHHTCTVGCQRSRQVTSKVLASVVSALQDYVPEKGPGGAAKQMQDTVKRSSGIDIGIGQAHHLIKLRRKDIKNATGRAPLSQKERIAEANNQLLENFWRELSAKDAGGQLAVMANTGKRKKAALAAAEVFFRMAGEDLAYKHREDDAAAENSQDAGVMPSVNMNNGIPNNNNTHSIRVGNADVVPAVNSNIANGTPTNNNIGNTIPNNNIIASSIATDTVEMGVPNSNDEIGAPINNVASAIPNNSVPMSIPNTISISGNNFTNEQGSTALGGAL